MVQKVELPKGHVRLRLILAVVFLVIGGLAIWWGLTAALNEDPGWRTIEVDAQGVHCGEDFEFVYDLGRAGASATVELKELTLIYSEATKKAYEIFHEALEVENVNNLAYLSAHPNEAVTVDPALYKAFALINRYENRNLFMGPVYELSGNLFQSENDAFAASFDPAKNPELAQTVAKIVEFAADPEHISIQLLGNNQVRLCVSSKYLEYVRQEQIAALVDFGWMKNAFIVDFFAETLAQRGYVHGHITSHDGFTRNLDNRGVEFGYNLFDYYGDGLYLPAAMQYSRPISIAYLRGYPMDGKDVGRYYRYSNGDVVAPYVDPNDGRHKFAADNLVSYSYDVGCSELLMQMASVYTADSLDTDKLNSLTDQKVYSVWFAEKEARYNEQGLKIQIKEDAGTAYTAAYAGK